MPTRTREDIEAEIEGLEEELDFAQQDELEADNNASNAREEASRIEAALVDLNTELEELDNEGE